MMSKSAIYFLFILFSIASCKDDSDDTTGDWYQPIPKTTFDWDLRGDIPENQTYLAEVIDIDAYDNDAAFITNLHHQGKKVIAYVSVGSIEDWRPDAGDFPAEIIGNDYPGWEGEKFLDIRNIDALTPIMRARFDMIKDKGFDGIEPDNIDLSSWTANELGFNITDDDVVTYSKWLADEAHQRGLSIGQKNAGHIANQLVDTFDWILLEDAFYYEEENDSEVYIQNNKAVFATEYDDLMTPAEFQRNVCHDATSLQYTAILKHRDIDDYIEVCD